MRNWQINNGSLKCLESPHTNNRVDIFGGVLSEGTDASALSRHREISKRPLTVHILPDDRTHLSYSRQTREDKKPHINPSDYNYNY